MARPRLGLFDQKFAQQPGYRVVDELAAVVGMKAANHKRELSEHRFEQWNQPKLRDLRRGGDNLPLRHFVDRVDVIDAFHAVAIALLDRVDAQISGHTVRLRLAPFANANHCRPASADTSCCACDTPPSCGSDKSAPPKSPPGARRPPARRSEERRLGK